MGLTKLVIRGARQHNLKNIDVEIPRNSLTVITGLSGSGKSSLAFDTIYAEGQRRYVESLSAYARQFLDQMERPTWTSSRACLPPSPSSRKPPRARRALLSHHHGNLRLPPRDLRLRRRSALPDLRQAHHRANPASRLSSPSCTANSANPTTAS